MSVKNALTAIQELRKRETIDLKAVTTLGDLFTILEKSNPPFSMEELKKALEIDWNLRWIKHAAQQI
ncbi:hypothetical protein [Chitinophaga sp. Cy-1792]|uniref:hypothetical protein n=1 Tax=Chitinophaga sp. Cy-1792 TaxID=2608339 RepID=UPI0014203460|nr:hypothetical protein [Chitinophaga sp. Cy-1792]NIG55373.1 hypothetical protein [Chitinophaga sp. Cy-1792]